MVSREGVRLNALVSNWLAVLGATLGPIYWSESTQINPEMFVHPAFFSKHRRAGMDFAREDRRRRKSLRKS